MPFDRDEDQSTEGGKKEETTYEIHRAEGDVLFKQAEYRKASESYTQALDLMGDGDDKDGQKKIPDNIDEDKVRKDEKDILVARSRCYLMMGKAEQALADAEASLKDDKNFIKGLFQKAEALYYQGDFETALVYYHRGNKLRPEVQEFRLGIQKAQEAINNSIGTPEAVKLENKGDLSHFYKPDEAKAKSKGKTYGKPGKQEEKKPQRQRPKSVGKDSKTIKELLGDLYQDREYLDKLLKEEEAMDQKTDSSQKIQDLCIEGINYLDSRTEFWRQQKPMYARKRDKLLQQQQQQRKGGQSMKYIVKNIEEIDEAQADGDYEKSLRMSKKTLKDVNKLNEEEHPNKAEVLASLYSYIGNAYLETNKYDLALEYHKKDYNIGHDYEIEDAKSRALDNLGRVHARMGDFQKAVDVWEEKLPMSKSDLEKTWLYHEIGRCYLELEEFDHAHDYGNKSLTAAQACEDDVWQLNASVLIAQAEVKQGDYEAAVDSFERSLEMARVQNDKPAEDAIKKALDDVNRKIVQSIKAKEETQESDQQDREDSGTTDDNKEQTDVTEDDKKSEKGHDSDDDQQAKEEEKPVEETPAEEEKPEEVTEENNEVEEEITEEKKEEDKENEQ